MKYLLGCVLSLSLVVGARGDVAADITAILRDRYLNKVDIGIAVARLGSDGKSEIIYRFESDIPLIPASNLKILTTSAFLDHFGGDFKFHTVLLKKGDDVYLIGDGDPTLGDVELLKKFGWDVTTAFKSWAETLKKQGVTNVRNVIVDDSVFDQQFTHANWSTHYANARYSAGVAGVNLNVNCIDFWIRATAPGQLVQYTMDPATRYVTVRNTCVTGTQNAAGILRPLGKNELTLRGQVDTTLGEPISITIADPAMYAATVLAETLSGSGIAVQGEVTRDLTVREQFARDPAGWSVVAALDTRLSQVLDRANKDSMNVYAEALCKRLGREISREPGSWENGTAAVGAFLKRIGVEESQFKVDDGCGLSRQNSVSPDTLLKVLVHNFHGTNRDVFLNSLAVAGVDGTFEKRFRTHLKGRVFGKSGYVNGVSAISGYLKARDDRWYAFSILMNNVPDGTNGDAKKVQERVIAAIDENAGP